MIPQVKKEHSVIISDCFLWEFLQVGFQCGILMCKCPVGSIYLVIEGTLILIL